MCKKLGILMLDTKFPRIVGDIGNEKSFDFEIVKKVVVGADPKAVVLEGDGALLPPFIAAAKELEQQGVAAITTSCGFLAMFQKELAQAVGVPVFSSALLWLPTMKAMLPPGKVVGVMTADSTKLSARHYSGVGLTTPPEVVYGMQNTGFGRVFVGNAKELDSDLARREMVQVAMDMVQDHPEVGAILFECTNMPPYASEVESATGRPVFHIINLANSVMHRQI